MLFLHASATALPPRRHAVFIAMRLAQQMLRYARRCAFSTMQRCRCPDITYIPQQLMSSAQRRRY